MVHVRDWLFFNKNELIINLLLGIEGPITRQTFVDLIEAFQHGKVSKVKNVHIDKFEYKNAI